MNGAIRLGGGNADLLYFQECARIEPGWHPEGRPKHSVVPALNIGPIRVMPLDRGEVMRGQIAEPEPCRDIGLQAGAVKPPQDGRSEQDFKVLAATMISPPSPRSRGSWAK